MSNAIETYTATAARGSESSPRLFVAREAIKQLGGKWFGDYMKAHPDVADKKLSDYGDDELSAITRAACDDLDAQKVIFDGLAAHAAAQHDSAYEAAAGMSLRDMMLAFDRCDHPAAAAGIARRMAETPARTMEDVGCKALVAAAHDERDDREAMLESIEADRSIANA